MTDGAFIHEHPEFADLLSIVSLRRRIPESLVEKDYWVTHVLWALEAEGVGSRRGFARSFSSKLGRPG